MKSAHKRIYINEVVARDGFQIEPNFVPTEEKIKLIDRLSRTGLADDRSHFVHLAEGHSQPARCRRGYAADRTGSPECATPCWYRT